MNTFSIHPATLLGPVYLSVCDLERSLRFYTDVIGFELIHHVDTTAWLGSAPNTLLLALTEQPDARPKPPRTTGLYHFAILVPSRLDLARSLRHLVEASYPLQGASDHLVSEALYITDPDGNGIEIYADRAREAWPRRDGQVLIATERLDLDNLLAELAQDHQTWAGVPSQTRIGHVHLQVADLPQTEAFYRTALGFDLVARYGQKALFVSAGGYHHHLGLNTWAGTGAPPPPPDAVGLRYFTITLPDEAEQRRLLAHLQRSGVSFVEQDDAISLQDPSNNGVLITVGTQMNDFRSIIRNTKSTTA